MRIRLVHTLSLWLLVAVGVTVLGMGGVTAWNLGQGFSAYLRARDIERLEKFALVVAEKLEATGGADALTQRRLRMRDLLDELARREGIPVPAANGPPGVPKAGQVDGPPPSAGSDRPAPDLAASDSGHQPPPPPGAEERFGARVAIVGLDGDRLIGRPLTLGNEPFVDRPIMLNGGAVALVRLRSATRVADENEVRFLRSQYIGIATVAVISMLSALLAAWWLARQWVRPLTAVQNATARIARGELSVRLPATRNDEIGDVVRNINLMAEGLQRLEGARRRWIADMSHELRTPLSVLRGEIEALVDGVRPLTALAAQSLREDVLRLATLVDDLHMLAMADLNSLPCHFIQVDAVQIVQDTLRRFESRAISVRLGLAWAAPPPLELAVFWDPARIKQLLVNLLENSLRYTDAPGRVAVRLQREGNKVQLQIEDSAPGVPTTDLARVFEPLYRADAARSRHAGGSGLGMAIAQAIVQAHGGHIQAETSVLGGLCVTIELPVDAKPPQDAQRTAT